jgi:hypothetical protein
LKRVPERERLLPEAAEALPQREELAERGGGAIPQPLTSARREGSLRNFILECKNRDPFYD